MGQYLNRGKRSFSEREKRAESAGLGYGSAKQGKFVKCETVKEKHLEERLREYAMEQYRV